jgi:Formate hydrogenlyase subunit 6/NADH:ubiquinone oxidoreductase 23 kD subunit (chain I)
MNSFLNIVLRNILKGPSTIKYPFGESPAPKGMRGKIKHNPEACMACHMCEHVCAGGAIRIQESEDKKGLDFVVWHNSCAFCGLCEHYCPTGAIHLTDDYHTAHLQQDKYEYVERSFVKYKPCISCGEPMVPLVPMLAEMVYGKQDECKGLVKMCEKCRRKAIWKDGVFK